MDLRQLEYIIAIEQEQSISQAAKKLFLTQSALNQQLLKLEKELGTPLFERRKHSMIPTFAGRVYLNTAHQMLDMKQQTYKIIHDISNEASGEIPIAYTPEAGSVMFSHIYPPFHALYPNITFKIFEARVKKMEDLILQREAHFAFIAYYEPSKRPELDYLDMSAEKMILGLPATHPLAHLAGDKSWETFPPIDLTLLKDDAFILLSRETRMRDMIDLSFAHAGFHPKVLFESISTRTVINMVEHQIGPAFFPQSYVNPEASMVYFTVAPFFKWMRGVAFLKGCYLTKPEKYFIALAADFHHGVLAEGMGRQMMPGI
ncbi:MAG: LysR family transcriptional regulator [Eubacteriales bacterium]|nr:LysR family transcriptional regulator [Eubacteriales bacterium]